ncbi:MAG TPA: sigma-70 family RNA polymerase sigma factor, partial [Verrucomicrobiales bacterium]|nr:sigma-70 family RNA polymerase sigma factor [Verrucomicrobiales bacterium]
MITDEELLRLFAEHRDEGAFAEIVQRHAGLVFGVARRRLQDVESARDVAQQVFTLLAAKAAVLHRGGSRRLAGWLHRTALLQAGNALRSARRRNYYHEAFASEMKIDSGAHEMNEAPWREALPLIDAAIDSLSAADREVVLGHYFQRRAFRDLAASAGRSDHAMQKRASRALDKLSAFLRRRGINVSAAALATGLGAGTAEAVPGGFAGAAAAAAVKSAPGLSAATLFANTVATMTLTKLTATAAAIAFLLPLGWQWRQNSHSAPPPARASGVGVPQTTGSTPLAARPGIQNPIASAAAQKSPLGILAGEIAKLD